MLHKKEKTAIETIAKMYVCGLMNSNEMEGMVNALENVILLSSGSFSKTFSLLVRIDNTPTTIRISKDPNDWVSMVNFNQEFA